MEFCHKDHFYGNGHKQRNFCFRKPANWRIWGFTCPAGLHVGHRCIVFFHSICCNDIDALIKTVIPTVDHWKHLVYITSENPFLLDIVKTVYNSLMIHCVVLNVT